MALFFAANEGNSGYSYILLVILQLVLEMRHFSSSHGTTLSLLAIRTSVLESFANSTDHKGNNIRILCLISHLCGP